MEFNSVFKGLMITWKPYEQFMWDNHKSNRVYGPADYTYLFRE